jgi:hypothetical protein
MKRINTTQRVVRLSGRCKLRSSTVSLSFGKKQPSNKRVQREQSWFLSLVVLKKLLKMSSKHRLTRSFRTISALLYLVSLFRSAACVVGRSMRTAASSIVDGSLNNNNNKESAHKTIAVCVGRFGMAFGALLACLLAWE